MRILLIIWLQAALLLLLPTTGTASSLSLVTRKCNKELLINPPKIQVKYNYGQLKIDHSHTSEDLDKMMKELDPEKNTRKLNGLTRLFPYIVVESSVVQTTMKKYHCYYPQSVSITVGYEPVVYLNRDLVKDSCRYNLTMRHERTHLDIGDLSLQKFLSKLQKILPQIVKDTGTLLKPVAEKAAAVDVSNDLNNMYRERLGTVFNSFVKEMVAQQMVIDTLENYDSEGKLCPAD